MGLTQQLYELKNSKICKCGILISRKAIMCRNCHIRYNSNLGNRNKTFSEEHKINLSNAHKGITLSKESKMKISLANSGRKFSDEVNKKKGLSMEKNPMWNGGKKEHEFGYILIKTLNYPELPRDKQGYVKRANLIWYEKTGEIIKKPFMLHHKDINPKNDSFKNLKKLTLKEHGKLESASRERNIFGKFV